MLKAIDSYLLIHFFQPLSFLLEKITGKNNFFWAKVGVFVYTAAFCFFAFITFGETNAFVMYAFVFLVVISGVVQVSLLGKKEKGIDFPGREKFEEKSHRLRRVFLVIGPLFAIMLLMRVLLVPDMESIIWFVWLKTYTFSIYFQACIPIPIESKSSS